MTVGQMVLHFRGVEKKLFYAQKTEFNEFIYISYTPAGLCVSSFHYYMGLVNGICHKHKYYNKLIPEFMAKVFNGIFRIFQKRIFFLTLM